MNSFPSGVEPGVDSLLVDLGAVPLAVLRKLDGDVLRRSLGHAIEQTRYVRVSTDGGGTERID